MNDNTESEFNLPMNPEAIEHAIEKTGDMAGILACALAHCVAFAPKGREQEATEASAELHAVCMSYACHFHYMAKVLDQERETIEKITDPKVRLLIVKLLASGEFKKTVKRDTEKFILSRLPDMAAELRTVPGMGGGPASSTGNN